MNSLTHFFLREPSNGCSEPLKYKKPGAVYLHSTRRGIGVENSGEYVGLIPAGAAAAAAAVFQLKAKNENSFECRNFGVRQGYPGGENNP